MIRKILLSLDGILLFLLVVVGVDYSYYIANVKYITPTETVILTDTLNLDMENTKISFENKKPNESIDYNFKVENLINKEENFNILLNNISNNYGKNLLYELYEQDKLVVSKTIAPQNSSNSYIKLNVNIAGGETKNYNLKFTLLNRENKAEEEFANKGFNAILSINTLSINNEIKTATNYIIASNDLSLDGSDGFIKTNDTNNGVSYYFKGNVNNNYVSFNNELWRIIRINENGSIRLIKNENIDGEYQYSLDSKQENSSNYLTSNIVNDLNSYYENNLKNYENMFEESNYCLVSNVVKNDNYKISENSVNYNAYSPSLKCSQENNLKIGLITYDEAILAGVNHLNSNSYLTSGNKNNTWTLSPAGVYRNNEGYVWTISNRKNITEDKTSNKNSIRPVINMKGTLNLTGEGIIENPYIFSE